jgi:hypothetical protein
LAAIFCLGFFGFWVAATIVLALIPVYLPSRQVTVVTIPNGKVCLFFFCFFEIKYYCFR